MLSATLTIVVSSTAMTDPSDVTTAIRQTKGGMAWLRASVVLMVAPGTLAEQ